MTNKHNNRIYDRARKQGYRHSSAMEMASPVAANKPSSTDGSLGPYADQFIVEDFVAHPVGDDELVAPIEWFRRDLMTGNFVRDTPRPLSVAAVMAMAEKMADLQTRLERYETALERIRKYPQLGVNSSLAMQEIANKALL